MLTSVPAWCINLERNPERWTAVAQQFAQAGVAIDRLPAVDGRALSRAELLRRATPLGALLCTRGMVGCFLSHHEFWARAAASGARAAAVFEDDEISRRGLPRRAVRLVAELAAEGARRRRRRLGRVPARRVRLQPPARADGSTTGCTSRCSACGSGGA